jgi:hypothetical protein
VGYTSRMHITCEPNKNIFILYCYLNYCGYDDENSKQGMHLVRLAVRRELSQLKIDDTKLKQYFKDYFASKKVHLYHFNRYAVSLKTDDSFEVVVSSYSTDILPDFNSVLRDFYEVAPVEQLWDKYYTIHTGLCEKYDVVAGKVIDKTNAYFSLKEQAQVSIVIVPNLLESYYRNKALAIGDQVYLSLGPYKNDLPHVGGIVHEYLHRIVNPIRDAIEDQINQYAYAFEKVPKTDQIVNSYNNWVAFFSESLVRVLVFFVLRDMGEISMPYAPRYLDNLMGQGFVLTKNMVEVFEKEQKPIKLADTLSNNLEAIVRL